LESTGLVQEPVAVSFDYGSSSINDKRCVRNRMAVSFSRRTLLHKLAHMVTNSLYVLFPPTAMVNAN